MSDTNDMLAGGLNPRSVIEYLDAFGPEGDRLMQDHVDRVRSLFGTDLCMVNLMLEDRQYFRAWSGKLPKHLATAREDLREHTVCQFVVDAGMPLVICDFLSTDRFRDHHYAVNYGTRFYAGAPLVTSDGRIIGTLCLASDDPVEFGEAQTRMLCAFADVAVTKLELTVALARERQARDREAQRSADLERVLDVSLDLIAVIDLDGIIRRASRASTSIFGYAPLDLIGRSLPDLAHEDDRERVREAIAHMASTGDSSTLSGHYVRNDGNLAWVEWTIRPLLDDVTMHCVARDITRSKQAEQKRRHQLTVITAITNSLTSGLFALDTAGCLTFANPAAQSMLGWSEADLLGKCVHDVLYRAQGIDESPRALASSRLVEELRAGTDYRNDDDSFTRKDGSQFPVAYTVAPIVEDEDTTGAVVIFRDMTQLRETELLHRQFVSNVCHELRTPLTSIKGYLEALLEDEAGPLNEEQRDYAEISYSNAERLQRLINDLLTLSRLGSGRMQLAREVVDIPVVDIPAVLRLLAVVDIPALLRLLAEEFRLATHAKQLRLTATAEPHLTAVGDRHRISQVLSNLVSNAIKFTPPGRSIRVEARRTGVEVVIEVIDQGMGIPSSDIPRLTERYFRASNASNVQGTGLGLAISNEIIQRQGGRLEIESREGSGSTFRVILLAAEQ